MTIWLPFLWFIRLDLCVSCAYPKTKVCIAYCSCSAVSPPLPPILKHSKHAEIRLETPFQ